MMRFMGWRRFTAVVLLALLCSSALDRCVIACLHVVSASSAEDNADLSPACHHEGAGDAAAGALAPRAVLLGTCDHESDATPGELTTVRAAGDQPRTSVLHIAAVVIDPASVRASGRVESDALALLVLESGSDRRQLRL